MVKSLLEKLKIFKIEVPKAILFLIIVASSMNLLRIIVWGKMSFVYILWNLFLALVPFVISLVLLHLYKTKYFNKVVWSVGLVLWVLFLPNAPYLITDIIHLGETKAVPLIYDSLLLFSSALLGLVLAFSSLSHIEDILRKTFSSKKTALIIVFIIVMVSFGMYLGRYLRFNSWDIFINHYALLKDLWRVLSNLAIHKEVYLFTLMYSFFLFFSYKAWKDVVRSK